MRVGRLGRADDGINAQIALDDSKRADILVAVGRELDRMTADPESRSLFFLFRIWKVGSCYTTFYIIGGGLYHIFLLYNTLYATVIEHVI